MCSYLTIDLSLAADNLSKDIPVFFIGNAPPYFIIKDNQVSGFMIDIVQIPLLNEGISTKFIINPWMRALVRAEKEDSLVVMLKSEDRLKKYNFSKNPIHRNNQYLFKIVEDKEVPLKDASIGLIRGYDYGDNQEIDKDKIIYINSIEQGVNLLKAKRINYFIGEKFFAKCLTKNLNINITAHKYLNSKDVFLARSKKFPTDLLQKFDNGYQKLSHKFKKDLLHKYLKDCSP